MVNLIKRNMCMYLTSPQFSHVKMLVVVKGFQDNERKQITWNLPSTTVEQGGHFFAPVNFCNWFFIAMVSANHRPRQRFAFLSLIWFYCRLVKTVRVRRHCWSCWWVNWSQYLVWSWVTGKRTGILSTGEDLDCKLSLIVVRDKTAGNKNTRTRKTRKK